MGAGNCCTTGQCEGLFYVDNSFLSAYRIENEDGDVEILSAREIANFDGNYEFDASETAMRTDEFEGCFTEMMMKRFPSFEFVDKWISRNRRALLENNLFYVVCEDNQWSIAIELIEKEVDCNKVGLQMGLYKKFLEGIKVILLEINGEVATYAGTWTHGIIKK